MRIVLTDTWSWPHVRRGGERILHELASALKDAGHEVRIVTTGRNRRDERILSVPVSRLPLRRPLGRRLGEAAPELAFGLQAWTRLVARRFDVWHAMSIPDGAAAALLGKVRPGLCTVFTDLGFPARQSRDKRPDRRLQDFLARHIDVYVCLSHAAGRYLWSDYQRDPVVIPPGVDTRRFKIHGPRDKVPTIMYSGTFDEPRKNVPVLLEAVARLRRRIPRLQLWLVGPGNVDQLLREAPAAARDAVTWAGPLEDSDLIARYGRAWVTTLPSHAEAFGLAITESWSSGTPVAVLQDSGGPAEFVRSPCGVLCQPTAEGLADGLSSALDLSRQPGTIQRCRAEAMKYDWRLAIVPMMERVYGLWS